MIKPIPGQLVGQLNENDHNTLFAMAVKLNEVIQQTNSNTQYVEGLQAGANALLRKHSLSKTSPKRDHKEKI